MYQRGYIRQYMATPMIDIINLNKTFDNGTHSISEINLSIKKGEFISIIGGSGSGKSTLLRCINRLVTPSSGEIFFKGKDICTMDRCKLSASRKHMGMIFQQFNLIPRQSVLQNTLYGALGNVGIWRSFLYLFTKKEVKRAASHLKRLGLTPKKHINVNQLSGGQQQRVAIARALMQSPSLILADEPVASLDLVFSEIVMNYLQYLNQKKNTTIISTFHSIQLVKKYSKRVIGLHSGKIVFDGTPAEMDDMAMKKVYNNKFDAVA